MLTIYCDGACEPTNPGGYACWAWIASSGEQDYGCVGYGYGMTNNIAEYEAVIQALNWAKNNNKQGFSLKTDSKLVVKQATNEWQVRAEHLKANVAEVKQLLIDTKAKIGWIPREANYHADQLARRAGIEAMQQAKTEVSSGTPESGKRTLWQELPPSRNQLYWLERFNCKFEKGSLTRGQSAVILAALFRKE